MTSGSTNERPWSVQVELSEGCNRLCTFCGLNGIRNAPGKFKFMTQETASIVASEMACLAPTARYEFAMHGEPLMNPEWDSIIGLFRMNMPKAQIQVTTNGIVTLKRGMQRTFDMAFAVGVDFIALDTYYPERDRLWEEVAKLEGIEVVDYYKDWQPVGKSPYANYRRKVQRTVVVMDDISRHQGEARQRTLFNHAGSNPLGKVPPEPLKKTCTIPFREMSICWNGNVNICCMDWKHEFTVGNVVRDGARAVWNSPAFGAARRVLQSKSREFTPCNKCDVSSGTRVGLLPKLPPPTEEDWAVVRHTEQASHAYDPRDFVQLRRSPK